MYVQIDFFLKRAHCGRFVQNVGGNWCTSWNLSLSWPGGNSFQVLRRRLQAASLLLGGIRTSLCFLPHLVNLEESGSCLDVAAPTQEQRGRK